MWAASSVPTAPAAKWLAKVAVRIPRITGSGVTEAGGEHQGEQLGLVPDLRQGDDAGGYEQRLHPPGSSFAYRKGRE